MAALNIVSEVMQRMRLMSFKEWLYQNEDDEYKAATKELDITLANLPADVFTQMMASPECKRLLEIYD